MLLKIDIYSILIFLGVVQGIFLFYVFVRNSRTNKANIYFALFIFTLSLIILEIYFNYTGLTARYLFLVDFSEPLNFCIAPLFYIYLRQNYFNLKTNKWFHLSYPLFYFCYCFLFWLQSDDFKYFAYLSAYDPLNSNIEYTQVFHHDPLTLKANVVELMVVQLVFYFVLIIRTFRKHKPLSQIVSKKIIYNRIIFVSALMIVAIIFVRNYFDADLGDHFLAVFAATVIYYLSYNVFSQSAVLKRNLREEKYSKSNLDETTKQEYRDRILQKLEEDKIYLDSNLNVSRLAKSLVIPVNQLSQVINECFNMNFNELINSYRIKAAQSKLLDANYENIKIEEIGYECGFNSKSSFFTAFKKYTNMTPIDFREFNQNKLA